MASCLSAGAADLPDAFSRPWCAYRTAHFEVLTDLPRRRALAEIRALGRFRTMFMALFPDARSHSGLPVRMLVFRRAQHFNQVTGASTFAGIAVPSLRTYHLLVGPARSSTVADTGRHEYAHYLMRNQAELHYPLWYEEGLANYLSAANLKVNPVTLGHLERVVQRGKGLSSAVSFDEAVQANSVADWQAERLIAFYEKAWLLVHFIRLGHHLGYPDFRPALMRYLKQPEQGFAAAFGLTPSGMGELIKDYLRQPRRRMEFAHLPDSSNDAVRTPVQQRCLDAAEGRLEVARSIVHLNPPLAARALETDPGSEPDADWLTVQSEALSAFDHERAMAAVEAALKLAPGHAGATAQLAHLKTQRCLLSSNPACMRNWAEAAMLYRQVLDRDPHRYDVAYGLGVAYLHTGRAEQALDPLRLAYERMPWAAEANFFLGEAYRRLGHQRAAGHLRKARSWTMDPAWRARAAAALTQLDDEF